MFASASVAVINGLLARKALFAAHAVVVIYGIDLREQSMIQHLLLRTIRVRLNISYQPFASHLGIGPSELRLIEAGARPLESLEIAALSRLLRNPPTAWKHALPPDIAYHYHRLQQRASRAVNYQMAKLPRVSCPCMDCGEDAVVYDHRDYLQPLDVQPVCQRCNYLRGVAVRTFLDHSDHWLPFDWIRL